MKLSILTAIFLTFSAQANEEWQYINPIKYYDAASLFHYAGCRLTFLVAYVYDTQSEQFLLPDDINQDYPGYDELIGTNEQFCNPSLSLTQLNEGLNASLDKTTGNVFLYFAPPYDPTDGKTIADYIPEIKTKADKRFALASKFNYFDKYLVRTPIKSTMN